MTKFNEGPRDPVNRNRPFSDRNPLLVGRWSSAMWIIAGAIVVVLIVVIARMSSASSAMVEQRAAAPETETTSGKAPIAPSTPTTASGQHTLSPQSAQPSAKP